MSKESKSETDIENTGSTYSWKMIPVILIYQLWSIAFLFSFGWLVAIPTMLVTGAWLSGWPKGILKNILFLITFGFIIPFALVLIFDIEPTQVTK